jgi:hypothetical protein
LAARIYYGEFVAFYAFQLMKNIKEEKIREVRRHSATLPHRIITPPHRGLEGDQGEITSVDVAR